MATTSSVSTSNGNLQVTGLASGLDTNSIIGALLQQYQHPIINLQNHQRGLQALNSQLTSIQSALRAVTLSAQGLADPGLFSPKQAVTSTNSALVAASATGSVGAVVGGYQVSVGNLATAAQRTFTYKPPAAGSGGASFTIDGVPVSLAEGASSTDLANQINSNQNATVWATASNSGTIVLSNRKTGDTGSGYINVADTSGTMTDQGVSDPTIDKQGVNASVTVNGKTYNPSDNTTTTAIPGVKLTLTGATGATPVTVNVGAPAADSASIVSAVKSFVNGYNAVLSQIQGQLTQTTVSGDPTKGTLFGDETLTDLISHMRQTIYTGGAGLPAGAAALSDIGVTTGSVAAGTFSQASVNGQLSVDTDKLTAAITNNPSGVKSLLTSFAHGFKSLVDASAQAGGSLDVRINGDNSQITDIGRRVTTMNEMIKTRRAALVQVFAKLEGTLSSSQSQSSWLSGQISQLSGH